MGGLYKKQGRIDDAVDAYRNAERITPNNSYPVINLALLYFMRGDTAAAEPLFMRSAAISARTLDGNPTDYWTRFDLATALLILGVLEEAQQHLTNAISQMKTAGPLEIFLNDLKRLKHAPTPPDHVDEMIEHVTKAMKPIAQRNAGWCADGLTWRPRSSVQQNLTRQADLVIVDLYN